MLLFLIRHSYAQSTSPDFQRELSERGIQNLKNSIQHWKSFHISFDIILTSPLVRAIQTAEIIKSMYSTKLNIITETSLSPGSNTFEIINICNALELEKIALIGHQPDLSIHLSTLASGGTGLNLSFAPAALAEISYHKKIRIGNGVLEKLLPPISQYHQRS